MAAGKEYTVVGPHPVLGHSTGQQFKATLVPDLELALVSGGHIVAGKAGEPAPEPEPLRCPDCEAHGTAADKKKTYRDYADLADHYADQHPALVAPTGEGD